jgi:hypothetical protein
VLKYVTFHPQVELAEVRAELAELARPKKKELDPPAVQVLKMEVKEVQREVGEVRLRLEREEAQMEEESFRDGGGRGGETEKKKVEIIRSLPCVVDAWALDSEVPRVGIPAAASYYGYPWAQCVLT